MKIAFQGAHGAYGEMACRNVFGQLAETLPCPTFEDVFDTVGRSPGILGIIPVENSLTGSITQNYDLLADFRGTIAGETYLRIRHLLLAPAGTSLRNVRIVRSHPQALAQCSRFFNRHKTIEAVPHFDTAGAAQSLSIEQRNDVAAIAGRLAALRYGLKVLKADIADRPDNITRFLIITRRKYVMKTAGRKKSTITFVPMHNEPGTLHGLLEPFARHNINIPRLEARPHWTGPFEYRFHLDLDGSPEEPHVALALKQVRSRVRAFRLLGTYGKARIPR
jgi:prephenate dehydratase